jgi:phosphoserine phosphatase
MSDTIGKIEIGSHPADGLDLVGEPLWAPRRSHRGRMQPHKTHHQPMNGVFHQRCPLCHGGDERLLIEETTVRTPHPHRKDEGERWLHRNLKAKLGPRGERTVQEKSHTTRQYLLASDFDQTLSFHDTGIVLSEWLGIAGFHAKVAGLSRLNLVQQGGELAYLLRHDPAYRCVRKEHLVEVGRRIRLKRNIGPLTWFLAHGVDGHRFDFYVISAAPEEVVQSALQGVVPPDHIIATRFSYDPQSGEIASIVRVPAGYGKVAAVDELQCRLSLPSDRVVYVGDGSSDIHLMLHLNHRSGFTIAVSEAKYIAQIAMRTIVSDDALSVLVPILEERAGYEPSQIRALFEEHGFLIQEWDKVRTDWLTIQESAAGGAGHLRTVAQA